MTSSLEEDGIDTAGLDQFLQCAYAFFQRHHSVEECVDKKFDEEYHVRNKNLEIENELIHHHYQIL